MVSKAKQVYRNNQLQQLHRLSGSFPECEVCQWQRRERLRAHLKFNSNSNRENDSRNSGKLPEQGRLDKHSRSPAEVSGEEEDLTGDSEHGRSGKALLGQRPASSNF